MKIAVIGSGAACVGVLNAIQTWAPQAGVLLVSQAEHASGPYATDKEQEQHGRAYNQDLYRHLRSTFGLKFPPPKTNFGLEPARRRVQGWGEVWESRTKGGLTNFWGASALPFTDDDLLGWTVSAADLAPYYQRMAAVIGISGKADAIGGYLGNDFINRPPILRPPVFDRLESAINRPAPGLAFRLLAGTGRLALETRPEQPGTCVYSGGCMTGCTENAVYSALKSIRQHEQSGTIGRSMNATVRGILSDPLRIRIEASGGDEIIGPFDRVFLCAGCIGSTEIIMRSLGLRDGPLISDNAVYTFPIFYAGPPLATADGDRHFALTNLLAYCIPAHADGRNAMIQVYPNIDYLWKYYLPAGLWPVAQPFGRFLRRRLLWGRVFLHGDYSQNYAMRLSGGAGDLTLSLARPPLALKAVPGLWPAIRAGLSRGGFYVPPVPPVRHATSSHYAASFPLGTGPVSAAGEFLPGAYLCDSAGFANAPSPSPTFTIMANACRIAHQAF